MHDVVIDITGKFILSEGKGLKRLGLNAGQVVGEYVLNKPIPKVYETMKLCGINNLKDIFENR